jgi:hypothetical protein
MGFFEHGEDFDQLVSKPVKGALIRLSIISQLANESVFIE